MFALITATAVDTPQNIARPHRSIAQSKQEGEELLIMRTERGNYQSIMLGNAAPSWKGVAG